MGEARTGGKYTYIATTKNSISALARCSLPRSARSLLESFTDLHHLLPGQPALHLIQLFRGGQPKSLYHTLDLAPQLTKKTDRYRLQLSFTEQPPKVGHVPFQSQQQSGTPCRRLNGGTLSMKHQRRGEKLFEVAQLLSGFTALPRGREIHTLTSSLLLTPKIKLTGHARLVDGSSSSAIQ